MENIYTALLFIIGSFFSHSFLNAMIPALRKNIRTVPKTTPSPFLQRRTFAVQPQKRFAPEFKPVYVTPIKPPKHSQAPPIVEKSFWGYLLAFLGLDALLTS